MFEMKFDVFLEYVCIAWTKSYPSSCPVQGKSLFKFDTISCPIAYKYTYALFFCDDLTWLLLSWAHDILEFSLSVVNCIVI